MERFEMTVIAQGTHSVWIALLVIAFICMTFIAMFFAFFARKTLFESTAAKSIRSAEAASSSSARTLSRNSGRQRVKAPNRNA